MRQMARPVRRPSLLRSWSIALLQCVVVVAVWVVAYHATVAVGGFIVGR